MNVASLVGRLVRDPQAIGTKGAVGFTIACRRDYKNAQGEYDADFINCRVFARQGEYALANLHKGDLVSVLGSISTGSWTDAQGVKRYSTDIMVRSLNNLSPRQTGTRIDPQTGFAEAPDDDELPY